MLLMCGPGEPLGTPKSGWGAPRAVGVLPSCPEVGFWTEARGCVREHGPGARPGDPGAWPEAAALQWDSGAQRSAGPGEPEPWHLSPGFAGWRSGHRA